MQEEGNDEDEDDGDEIDEEAEGEASEEEAPGIEGAAPASNSVARLEEEAPL